MTDDHHGIDFDLKRRGIEKVLQCRPVAIEIYQVGRGVDGDVSTRECLIHEGQFIGHEGPGASLLAIGDINLVHIGSDVRFALIGGRFVGEATLLRFYVIHCIAVPFIMMIFMAVHFWRIRKDGGISGPL